MAYYLVNALIGAIVAVCIAAISKSNYYILAALLPLFPTFTLFAQVNAYHIGGTTQLKEVILFGFISMISYIIYVGVMYYTTNNDLKFSTSLIISLSVWAVSAFFVFQLAQKYISTT